MDHGRDLMPAVQHSGMRKNHDASGSECRREVPLPPALQAFERSALPHRVVLGSIELVNPLLEVLTIESHFRTAWTRSRSADYWLSGTEHPVEMLGSKAVYAKGKEADDARANPNEPRV